jgi:hypothetical protein
MVKPFFRLTRARPLLEIFPRFADGRVSGSRTPGAAGIPAEWRSKLALLETIEELAHRLHDAARV